MNFLKLFFTFMIFTNAASATVFDLKEGSYTSDDCSSVEVVLSHDELFIWVGDLVLLETSEYKAERLGLLCGDEDYPRPGIGYLDHEGGEIVCGDEFSSLHDTLRFTKNSMTKELTGFEYVAKVASYSIGAGLYIPGFQEVTKEITCTNLELR